MKTPFIFILLGLTVGFALFVARIEAHDTLRMTEDQGQSSPSGVFVHFADDYLTVKARDVPLRKLLQEIARQSGLTLVLRDALEANITIEFNRLSLDEGLRRILRQQSFAVEYSQREREDGQSTTPRPTKLWILYSWSSTASSAEQSIPSPVPDRAILWGTIQTETGEIVTGEQLKLYSASLNRQHVTISNEHGEFLIVDITPANDYNISVSPRGMYQRYEADIEIGANQTYVKIILRDLGVGLLTGRIVNIKGNPVPGFTLSIRSLPKPRWSNTVTGDEGGRFEVGQVPQGGLEISRLDQLLKITGLHFTAGSSSLLNLVVDFGPYTITGHAYDELGEPIAGASVLLNWVYTLGGVRSVTNRRTMTDPSGKFAIDGLGEGPHDLIISLSDAGVYRHNIDVGNETGQIEAVLKQR